MNRLSDAVTRPVWHDICGMNRSANQYDEQRAPASMQTDVAIIGGGLSGLWTAYYLSALQPDLRIALLEARRVGFGASGRNGGWCSGFLPLSLSELAEVFDADSALAAYHASFDTLDEIESVLRRESIECDWFRGGTIQSASTAVQAQRLQVHLAREHRAGLTPRDLQWIPAARVDEHLHLAQSHGAIFSPHCATVNPFALVQGVARAVRNRGVQVFEDTSVRSFVDGVVQHEHGSLRAGFVIQATEGYSGMFHHTKRRLVPLYSLMVATEPLSDSVVSALGWRNRVTFNDGGHMIIYAQLTADQRIAFGGRGAPYHFGSRTKDSFDLDNATHERIIASIARHFPAASDARITHRWGGPLGVPRDWTPSITVDHRARYAWLGGYVGDGVAATNLFARTLVDVWLERHSPLVTLPFVGHVSPRWEREPLRYLGINGLLKLSESIDAYEERQGRVPHLRTKILNKLL